jgi:uncharacterized coiled-coil DUF342 family protein
MTDLIEKAKLPIEDVDRFMELTEKAKDLRDQLKEVNDEMVKYRDELLRTTQELDVYTLKTGDYTISRVVRITPVVEDFNALRATLEAESIPFETEEVFKNMDSLFKEAIKQDRELSGLGKRETQYISVRVNKGGDNNE